VLDNDDLHVGSYLCVLWDVQLHCVLLSWTAFAK
jgi:hypothetical protein